MDKRNLLLISNSTMRGEAYLGWCKDMIADFCNRHNVKKVLFVPYAGVSLAEGGLTKSYDAYEAKVAAVYKEFGVKLTSVHHKALPIRAEMQRMAVQSFAKPVALWRAGNAPVQGKRYNDYLKIAQQMMRLLGV